MSFARKRTRRPRLCRARTAVTVVLTPAAFVLAALLLLRWLPPPTTTFMIGWRLQRGETPAYVWVPRGEISRQLALAVVAAEDQKFPEHTGFDFDAIEDALHERRANGRVRGASTISQQVAKNLFLWSGRSWIRKALEAGLTVCIECLWPKRRILEVYLNVAQFGDGVFGAEAAALWAFGRPAASLDGAQAALLAAVLPDPTSLSAASPSPYVRERGDRIRAQMRALGGIRFLDQVGF